MNEEKKVTSFVTDWNHATGKIEVVFFNFKNKIQGKNFVG